MDQKLGQLNFFRPVWRKRLHRVSWRRRTSGTTPNRWSSPSRYQLLGIKCRTLVRRFSHALREVQIHNACNQPGTSMIIRQSSIKQWQECPLRFRYQHVDGLEREQSGAVVFGSIIHDCVLYLETTQDLEATVDRFKTFWQNPELLDPEYRIDYYVRGTNWKKYLDKGQELLRNWWNIIEWDSDLTLAREYFFEVPIGNGHTLQGTADKVVIRWNSKLNTNVLLISDYKTNNKRPTYDYLEEDLQFSAYCYASEQPEFWDGMPNGAELYEQYKDLPRRGEWVALTTSRRMDAGERTPRHYERLALQVDAMARSIEADIYTLNISGETCRYCDFRKQCGLPEIEEPED